MYSEVNSIKLVKRGSNSELYVTIKEVYSNKGVYWDYSLISFSIIGLCNSHVRDAGLKCKFICLIK